MANLFVVFTPLQVVIAQQIIRQEKLSDNVMLESWWDGYSHFGEIYKLITIDELWTKSLFFKNWASWDYSNVDLFKNALKIRKRYRELTKILKDNKIDTLYLADFQNQTNRFSCVLFAHLGYRVVFYEEGYSHYIPRPFVSPPGTLMHNVYEKILDFCYFRPLYHIDFASWRCCPNKDYHGLPITLRYSVIPHKHHEPYDRVLKCVPMISLKLQTFINEELKMTGKKQVLLLTDPMTEVLQAQYRHLYFETISDTLDKYTNEHIIVKFHPRDNAKDNETILELIKNKGLKFSVLGERINIPVELYLQNCHFEEILFFNTSTFFYNGYLFPKHRFVKLLHVLYNKCITNRVPNLNQMEILLHNIGD